jgi:hypothetical protein
LRLLLFCFFLHFFYRHTTLPQPLELLVTHLQEQDSAMTMKSAIPQAGLVLKARFLDKLAIHLQTLINVDHTLFATPQPEPV